MVIYQSPQLDELRQLVAGARARLAELEASYTSDRAKVDALRARLFKLLRADAYTFDSGFVDFALRAKGRAKVVYIWCQSSCADHRKCYLSQRDKHMRAYYQERDRLRLILEYRRKYLDGLLRGDEDEEAKVEENFQKAKAESDRDYQDAESTLAKKKPLTEAHERELALLWKKLVKLYHPDRFAGEVEKRETYEKPTSAINRAKDNGDISILREIANDPHGFILRQG